MQPSTIAALAHVGFFVVRVDADGTVISSDGPGLAAVGLAPGVGVGQRLSDVLADADPPGALEAARARARLGDATRLTLKWRAVRYLVTVSPHADGADVVGFAAADQAHPGDSADALGGLVNQLDGMVYRCQVDASWTMDFVTDGCLAITGYTADQLRMNRDIAFGDLVHPDDQGWLYDKCTTNLACRRSCSNQYRIRHADGTYRWVWDRAHGVYDDAGALLQVEGLITDITAERAREVERARLEDQVRHAQRLDSLGLLAGGVAHDFNNLLQVILGHGRLARTALPSGGPATEHLDAIDQAAGHARELTSQLLTFGRRQPVTPTVVGLNDVVGGQVQLLRRLLPESIALEFIAGRALPLVEIDVTQLQQVITNLCLNARDAMPRGGRLTLESETVLVNDEYQLAHPWAKPGRYVLLSVVDTGAGMAPEIVRQIFEPFFTTKPSGAGTGLGLAIVYGIVRAHDGMVHVYSEPGVGTTFKIYVPASLRLAATVGSKLDGAPPGGRERVLVADDEPGVRSLVVRILRGAGYEVLEAPDGLAAVRVFEANAPVDLVLVDAMMPGLNGADALRQMRALRPETRAIMSTGHSRELIEDDGQRPEILLKPFAPDELLRTVRRVIDRR